MKKANNLLYIFAVFLFFLESCASPALAKEEIAIDTTSAMEPDFLPITGDIASAEGTCYLPSGNMTIKSGDCESYQAVLLEGSYSLRLVDSQIKSTSENLPSVTIRQGGNAKDFKGIFNMTGGTLANGGENGPLFFVTNSFGEIALEEVDVNALSGILLEVAGDRSWGVDGGRVLFTATRQQIAGDVSVDAISTATLALQSGSRFLGAINPGGPAGEVNLIMDSSSLWQLTADSHLTCLSAADGFSGSTLANVSGNGFNVYYDEFRCPELAGATYPLMHGGLLMPEP